MDELFIVLHEKVSNPGLSSQSGAVFKGAGGSVFVPVKGENIMEDRKEKLEKILLTVSEAAEMCGYSRSFLYNLIDRGEIPVVRVGRSTRIPKMWLEKWVEKKVADWEKAHDPEETPWLRRDFR